MDAFVARQPIFDANHRVYAYELLFRSGVENAFGNADPDTAAGRVIADSAAVFGFKSLTAGRKAFVNVTRQALTEGFFSLLPRELTVVELLETVEPDTEVVEACKAVKQAGYLLALDDFVDGPAYGAIVELADFIKVDFLQTTPEGRRDLANRYKSSICLLAEKVETKEEHQEGIDLGYELFQGYYFCQPEIISRSQIPTNKFNYLRFLHEIAHAELDFDQLEEIIKQDVSLTVKLLRLLNSAAFGYSGRVDSVKQALMALGEKPIKRWATMLALGELGEDRPQELLTTCLIRARFCELLAPLTGMAANSDDLFLVGGLSLVDALVGRPMPEILEELAVSEQVRGALVRDDNPMARARQLAIAHERGDWLRVHDLGFDFQLAADEVSNQYREAVRWADVALQH